MFPRLLYRAPCNGKDKLSNEPEKNKFPECPQLWKSSEEDYLWQKRFYLIGFFVWGVHDYKFWSGRGTKEVPSEALRKESLAQKFDFVIIFCHAHILTSGQTTRAVYIQIMLFFATFSWMCYSGMQSTGVHIKLLETSRVLIETKSITSGNGLGPRSNFRQVFTTIFWGWSGIQAP